jgi:hypothetical protein
VRRRRFLASGTAAVTAGIAPARALVPQSPSLRDKLRTRAESSDYRETSTYADVQTFLEDLDLRGAPIFRGSLGKSVEGRNIPYVIASRPRVETPEAARALVRPIVLIVASLRGNDVDGKEAVLAILRDLCLATEKTLLEDLVLAIVPIANPDGSERFGPEERNAPDQNGPGRIGVAANARGLDLDSDFVKLETPEVRALLEFVNRWQPDAFVDLRSEAGSFVDFGITHAPSLHPAAYFGGTFARDRLLPSVHQELHEKFGVETFACGHFGRTAPLAAPPPLVDVENYGWFAPDYRTRHATNYMGLRGLVAATGASYRHDPFERRVFCTRAFVESVLGFCSENDDDVLANTRTVAHWLGGIVPIRAAYPSKVPPPQTMAWENLALSSDGDEPGMPDGLKRSGTFSSAPIPLYDRYVPTLYANGVKGYLIPKDYSPQIKRLLERHGIIHSVLIEPQALTIQQFVVGRIEAVADPVQGHRTISVSGTWREPFPYSTTFGMLYVSNFQSLGILACEVLEPESDDSFFTWNAFEGELKAGYLAPVFRIV